MRAVAWVAVMGLLSLGLTGFSGGTPQGEPEPANHQFQQMVFLSFVASGQDLAVFPMAWRFNDHLLTYALLGSPVALDGSLGPIGTWQQTRCSDWTFKCTTKTKPAALSGYELFPGMTDNRNQLVLHAERDLVFVAKVLNEFVDYGHPQACPDLAPAWVNACTDDDPPWP